MSIDSYITWSQFKTLLPSAFNRFTCVTLPNKHVLSLFIGQKEYKCALPRPSDWGELTAEQLAEDAEYDADYAALANKPTPTLQAAIPDHGGFTFKGTRIASGTIAANSSATFNYTLDDDLVLTGVMSKCYGAGHFDHCTFQIVAPAGHPLGNPLQETIFKQPGTNWGVSDDLQLLQLYKSQLYTGLVIRTIYTNTGSNAVDFWLNALLHKQT